MPSLARRERVALAELLDRVGPDAPTLCAGWTSYDLVAHLVLRDASPAALVGVVVPALDGLTDRAMGWVKSRNGYCELVRRLREGPPWYSPMRPSRIDRATNTLEFYVHHEDVRRGGSDHTPRDLSAPDQATLWASMRRAASVLGRKTGFGVELVRSDAAGGLRISGEPSLVVRGLPSELALVLFGRGAAADVAVSGDAAAVEAFEQGRLGL